MQDANEFERKLYLQAAADRKKKLDELKALDPYFQKNKNKNLDDKSSVIVKKHNHATPPQTKVKAK